jgi:hypothetical protein
MSNVRPHKQPCSAGRFGGAGSEFEDLGAPGRARSRRLQCVQAQRRREADTKSMATAGAPRTDLGFFGLGPRSLSWSSRLVVLAQAARPLAGGSPDFARGRAVQAERSVAALTNRSYVWYENEHKPKAGHSQPLRGCTAPALLSASSPWLGQVKLGSQCGKPKRCGLTLPSSGRPPAWPAKLLRLLFRSAGQSGVRLSCQTLGPRNHAALGIRVNCCCRSQPWMHLSSVATPR